MPADPAGTGISAPVDPSVAPFNRAPFALAYMRSTSTSAKVTLTVLALGNKLANYNFNV